MAKELSEIDSEARFTIVNGGDLHLSKKFTELAQDHIKLDSMHELDALERQWLTSGETERLDHYIDILGSEKINRILIADRNVGAGYVSCGYLPQVLMDELCPNGEARSKFLVGLLDFLFETLQKEKMDVVVNYAVAGSFTLASSFVCDALGVEFRRFNLLRIGHNVTFDSSPETYGPRIGTRYNQLLNGGDVDSGLLEKSRAIIQKFARRPAVPEYQYTAIKMLNSLPSLKTIAALLAQILLRKKPKHLRCMYPSSQLLFLLRRMWAQLSMHFPNRWGGRKDVENSPFAYYPLHYDPEASTMVLSPMLTNQMAVLDALSKSIPPNWKLAVKEHVTMLGRRPKGFYETLKKNPKIVLISPLENQFKMMGKAQLICTITGTAGWEAMLMGKVPLFFGVNHFQQIGEGFVQCSDFAKLPEAVESAVSMAPVSGEKLEMFVAAMLSDAFEMAPEFFGETGGIEGLDIDIPAQAAARHLLSSMEVPGEL